MSPVYLSLGSNLGQRKRNIKRAIALLNKSSHLKLERLSSFYETEPVGFRDQPLFINACLKGRTDLSAVALLRLLKEIEKKLGRRKTRRWGPRQIDIDILFYGKEKIKRRGLIIPHPRIEERLFVLEPLAEISPKFRHPVSGLTMHKLWQNL